MAAVLEREFKKIYVGDEWYYHPDEVPPVLPSPLDDMRYSNNDISLEEAVANNGGRFFIANADLLNADWLTDGD